MKTCKVCNRPMVRSGANWLCLCGSQVKVSNSVMIKDYRYAEGYDNSLILKTMELLAYHNGNVFVESLYKPNVYYRVYGNSVRVTPYFKRINIADLRYLTKDTYGDIIVHDRNGIRM